MEKSQAKPPATLSFLQSRRDWALSAPRDEAPIVALCLRPEVGQRRFARRLRLDPEEGVVGDRWIRKTWMHLPDGRPDPRIQVCLLGARVLQLVRGVADGSVYPGDNVIADMDFSEENLPAGQRLQLGSAVIEVSNVFNTACSKWQQRYGAASLQWINLPENKPYRLRGILARVVQGGEVGLEDCICKL